ncbi:hypothetical protein J4Q44_G00346440 [Coregonus suidteri]|uniref:Secreted protein n=1 Tax=Coregonus suidteri TaxID=861788 RepID=A0AAN8KPF1_9TELE
MQDPTLSWAALWCSGLSPTLAFQQQQETASSLSLTIEYTKIGGNGDKCGEAESRKRLRQLEYFIGRCITACPLCGGPKTAHRRGE